MRNAEIAAAFRELGALYELDGANRFRVLATFVARLVALYPRRTAPASDAGLVPDGDPAPDA